MEISEQVDSTIGRAYNATSKEFKQVFKYFILFNTLYQNPKAFELLDKYNDSKRDTPEEDSAGTVFDVAVKSVNRLFYYANTFQDLQFLMLNYLIRDIPVNIWMLGPTMEETSPILDTLIQINALGLVTTEGQPGICKDDSRQREYLQGIIPKKNIKAFLNELQKYPIYVDLREGFFDEEGEIQIQDAGFYVQGIEIDNEDSYREFMIQENKAYRELKLGYDYDFFNPETMAINYTIEKYPDEGWQPFTRSHFQTNDDFTNLQTNCNPDFTYWMVQNTFLIVFVKRHECEMDMLNMILQALQDSLINADNFKSKPKHVVLKSKKKKK